MSPGGAAFGQMPRPETREERIFFLQNFISCVSVFVSPGGHNSPGSLIGASANSARFATAGKLVFARFARNFLFFGYTFCICKTLSNFEEPNKEGPEPTWFRSFLFMRYRAYTPPADTSFYEVPPISQRCKNFGQPLPGIEHST